MQLQSTFITIVISALLVGCSQERSLTPREQRSRVYVTSTTTVNHPPKLFVFDAEADSLIDSLVQPLEWGDYQIVCDPDEPRFATINGRNARLYRGADPSPYIDDTLPTVYFAFDGPRGVCVGSTGSVGGVVDPLLNLYSLPALSVVHSDTISLKILQLDRERGLAYGVTTYAETPGAPYFRMELCAYDYVNRRPHRCWNILPDSTGRGYDIGRFALHPDGRRVYFGGGKSHFFCYDLVDDRVLFDVPVYSPYGYPEVSPDGREVWKPEEGLNRSTDPGTITIYDAYSGAVKDVIDLNEYRIRPLKPIRPSRVCFTPSGKKAYVLCYGEAGPVLVLDAATREVIKSFYFRTGEIPERRMSRMDIGPAP